MTHQAKLLQDTMATVQKAYYASRPLGAIRVHEETNNASISIDLYNFEGDGKDVCDGLEFNPTGEEKVWHAFCVSYDPDRENPLIIIAEESTDVYCDYEDFTPGQVPETTLANITTWLWNTVKQSGQRSVWMRLGVTVTGTDEEIEALFNEDDKATETLRSLLERKQFVIDGNAYIPDICVGNYNEAYHTKHKERDYDFDL